MNTVTFGLGEKVFLGIGGFVADWRVWTFPFELMSKNWKCVSYDHRGVGESPAPIETITVDALVDDVFGVMDKLGIEKCILGGESHGGTIACLAALKHPERFDGLVLVDTSGPEPTPIKEDRQQFINLLQTDFQKAMEFFIQGIFPEPESLPYRRMGLSIVMRPGAEVAVQYMHVMAQGPTNVPIQNIKMPTLVVYGTLDDPSVAENSKRLAMEIPNAILKVVDGAGHVPLVSKPFQVVEAIENRFR